MLKRIEGLKCAAADQTEEKATDMTVVKYKFGTKKDKWTDLVEYTGILNQIQAVEDALTRVQARKQKAIDSLHRYGFDDARLELDISLSYRSHINANSRSFFYSVSICLAHKTLLQEISKAKVRDKHLIKTQ